MKKATIENELLIETPNEVGMAGQLTTLISEQVNVNTKALCGRVVNGKGEFSIITGDNSKVADILKNSNFDNFREQNVLVVRTTDSIGTCAAITNKIATAGININYLFTTIFDKEPAVVLSTENNQEALHLFD